MPWFATRCVFRIPAATFGEQVYKERVTLWTARDEDAAIALAEEEAAAYARDLDMSSTGLVQCYWLADEPGHGAEVFSLMRVSDMDPSAYLDHFFDTGTERQREP